MSLFRRILTTREKPPPPVYMRGVQLSDVVFLIERSVAELRHKVQFIHRPRIIAGGQFACLQKKAA